MPNRPRCLEYFYFSNSEVMDKYSTLYDNWEDYGFFDHHDESYHHADKLGLPIYDDCHYMGDEYPGVDKLTKLSQYPRGNAPKGGRFQMLHIYTLHFKNDYWVDLQVESFKKHIKVPYKSYAIFSHMNKEMYEKNENNFDYFEIREKGRRLHKGGHYHPTDGNRHIFPIIKENLNEGDVVIRIDSDAFLIDDITDDFIDKINDKKFKKI